MIIAKFDMDESRRMLSLRVKGHAGAAASGQDIICSAASILSQTLQQAMMFAHSNGKLKYKPVIKNKFGDAITTVRAKDDSSYAELMLQFFTISQGYALMAYNYPQFVAVELLGSDKES